MPFSRLGHEKRGNVLMIMGFALIPLTLATGMAIDYSSAGRLQTKLNAAADAAALSGTTKPMLSQPLLAACNTARNTFLNALQQHGAGLVFNAATGPTVAITETYQSGPAVTQSCPNAIATNPNGNITDWCKSNPTDSFCNGNPLYCPWGAGVCSVTSTAVLPISRTVKVTYAANSTNAFGRVLGASIIQIGGTATARSQRAQYIDIHIALDTSQSMGLAASSTDALALWNATKAVNGPNNGCTFGCHAWTSSDTGYNSSKLANDTIAKNYGIRLRIDELRDATADMVQSAIDNSSSVNFYRFALYRMGATSSTIAPLSNNLSSVKSTASTVTLGPNTAAGTGDTNIAATMTGVLPLITARGDGTTQGTARPFFFLITDGVSDIVGSCTYGHCTKAIDPAMCQIYKSAGITVGVVYTTYLPVYVDPTNPSNTALRQEYANLVKIFTDPSYTALNPSDNSLDIKPTLQACASPGWFFQADDATALHTAMNSLFSQVITSATITQ